MSKERVYGNKKCTCKEPLTNVKRLGFEWKKAWSMHWGCSDHTPRMELCPVDHIHVNTLHVQLIPAGERTAFFGSNYLLSAPCKRTFIKLWFSYENVFFVCVCGDESIKCDVEIGEWVLLVHLMVIHGHQCVWFRHH